MYLFLLPLPGGFSWRCCQHLGRDGTDSWGCNRQAHGCRQGGIHWIYRGMTLTLNLTLNLTLTLTLTAGCTLDPTKAGKYILNLKSLQKVLFSGEFWEVAALLLAFVFLPTSVSVSASLRWVTWFSRPPAAVTWRKSLWSWGERAQTSSCLTPTVCVVVRLIKRASKSFKPDECPLFSDFPLSVEDAVEQSHFALFFNQGQCCCAGSRTYVQEDVYDEFVERSVERAKRRMVGDPFDLKTEQGPQVTSSLGSNVVESSSFSLFWHPGGPRAVQQDPGLHQHGKKRGSQADVWRRSGRKQRILHPAHCVWRCPGQHDHCQGGGRTERMLSICVFVILFLGRCSPWLESTWSRRDMWARRGGPEVWVDFFHFLLQIFGPVMQIMKFKSLEEVVERANDTKYGLAAAVFTTDINKAHYISNGLRAGTVWYAMQHMIHQEFSNMY